MKKIAFVMLAMGFLLAGCNTINGLGKDVEKLGEKVQDATKK
jgi:entericidin A